MRMLMRMFVAAWLPKECEEDQTPAVEACHRSGDHQQPETIHGPTAPSALDDRVFRQEAGETDMRQRNADTGDRQRANHHGGKSIGDLFAQAAVVGHVLLVVHRMDDRPRP